MSPTPRPRVAVVPPRYGEDVVGGAEAVLRELAEGLVERGWDVDALTTCARDHFTWRNDLPEGESTVNGVRVLRFPTVEAAEPNLKYELDVAINNGSRLTIAQEQRWANAGMRVPGLFHYILDHGRDYDALIYAPYLFWTTYACAPLHPARTVLMPCLHDEPFARLDVYKPLFTGSRDVWYLSDPECELSRKIFDRRGASAVVGSGINVPESYDADGFRAKYGIKGRFILYGGRREGAKGWETLLDQFARINARIALPFSLVTFGSGEINPPLSIADRVMDIGFISESEKNSAYAAADAYIQPSTMESFSRTVLESWLAGTIVIANGGGAVVRWHCERSGAGITYDDEAELQACLEFVATEPEAAQRLAAAGREYVTTNYAWPRVLDVAEERLRAVSS